MGRIIINNRTELSEEDAILLVYQVIKMGRISNDGKQYCYVSAFGGDNNRYCVATDLRKKSDSFVIYKDKNNL
jgi:hypothetical protein